MGDDRIVAVSVRLAGRVQGVGFRYWTKRRADELGVQGYVRNLANGGVEAALEGPATQVELMLLSLQEGPPLAEVRQCRQTEELPVAYEGFVIRG